MDLLLDVLRFIWTIFLVIMVFNFMILVHEYGHYIAARWRGLVVDRFQIWFGKPIWKKTINGVQYGLGSIPAGGFVSLPQMVTMESIEGKVDDEVKATMPPASPLDKIIVAFAGPLFSFLLAVVFAVIAWGVKYPHAQAEMTTTVGTVVSDSPADRAGLRAGDRIREIEGVPIDRFLGMGNSVKWQVVAAPPGPAEFVVERDGSEQTIVVDIPKPEPKKVEGGAIRRFFAGIFARPPLPQIGAAPRISPIVGGIYENSPAAEAGLKKGDEIIEFQGQSPVYVDTINGWEYAEGETAQVKVRRGKKFLEFEMEPRAPDVVEISDEEAKKKFLADPPLLGILWDARGENWLASESPDTIIVQSAISIYKTLQKVFSPTSAISGAHLSGPIGIGGILFDFFRQEDGWRKVLYFGALLNVNLAILNLLPFPVLDGGHIVMATAEWIRKKPAPLRLLEVVQTAFVLLLFGFMIYITFKDFGDRSPSGPRDVIEWSAREGA